MINSRISKNALLFLLLVSRLSLTFFYSFPLRETGTNSADLLAILLFLPLVLLFFVPAFLLLRRTGGQWLSEQTLPCAPLRRGALALSGLFLLFAAGRTCAWFTLFLKSDVFPLLPEGLFPLLLLFFAAFAAMQGIEGLGRAAPVIALLMVAVVAVLFCYSLPYTDPLGFAPPVWFGSEQVRQDEIILLADTAELVIFPLLAACAEPGGEKKLPLSLLLWAGLAGILLTNVILVSGGSDAGRFFPYYFSAALADSDNGVSLESVLCGCWFIGVFLKLALLLCLAARCFARCLSPATRPATDNVPDDRPAVFVKKAERLAVWPCAGAVALAVFLLFALTEDRTLLYRKEIPFCLTVGIGSLLPLLLLPFARAPGEMPAKKSGGEGV